MKTLVGMLAAASAFLSFAEADPYAGYIQLKTSDNPSTSSTSWKSSWGNQGNWDDTEGPVSTKNYYVPSGRTLACPNSCGGSNTAGANDWKGGQLVIGGRLQVMVTSKAARLPKVDDLVFLADSQLYSRWNYFGFLNSQITVLATADHPLLVDSQYGSAAQSMVITGSRFVGGADAGMIVRCTKSQNNALTAYNFEANTLKDYYGRIIVTNTLTSFKSTVDNVRIGGTLEAADGAVVNMVNSTTAKNAYLGGLDVHDGAVVSAYASGSSVYPQFNVSNALSIARGGVYRLSNVATLAGLRGFCAAPGDSLAVKVGTLTQEATASDFEGGVFETAGNLGIAQLVKSMDWSFSADAAEDSGKDVYVRAENVMFYNGASGDNATDSAFRADKGSSWSTGVTPSADSAGHFIFQSRFTTPSANLSYPNATLTLGNASVNSWIGGGTVLQFKTINFLPSATLNSWKGTGSSLRQVRGEVINMLGDGGGTIALVSGGLTMDILPELRGSANLTLRLHTSQCKSTASGNLVNLNTNFTGRLVLGAVTRTTTFTENGCHFRTVLNDARNWGGPYAGDDAWQSVTVADAEVVASNSVSFTEPTRGIHLLRFARIGVDEGKTMKLANQVTFAGRVDKQGAGTLELAGSVRFIDGAESTAPAEGTNVLTVTEGAVRVSSATACDGLQMVLRDGGKLVVPYGSETGIVDVKWDEPFVAETTDGKIPLEVDLGNADPGPEFTTRIFTVSAAAAANLSADDFNFTCSNRKFKFASLNRTYDEATDSYAYSATFEVRGMMLIFY